MSNFNEMIQQRLQNGCSKNFQAFNLKQAGGGGGQILPPPGFS